MKIGEKYYNRSRHMQIQIVDINSYRNILDKNNKFSVDYSGFEVEFVDNTMVIIYYYEDCTGKNYEGIVEKRI